MTTQDSGKAQQSVPDDAVLAFACGENRAVLTLNRRHSIRLHRAQPEHDGIIGCTFDPAFAALAARIDSTVPPEEPIAGRLIRINRPPR